MTNATKTLAIVFAGTLVLALATSWSWSSSSTAALQEKLLTVDTSAVQAVQIDRSGGSALRLERGNEGWSVVPSDTSASYPANSQSVTDLLTSLPSLPVNAVTTRQPDKHPRYGVDSTGTVVTMIGADDETLGQLIVGRTDMRRSQTGAGGRGQNLMQRMRRRRGNPVTYVRQPDAQDVYSINQSLRFLANRSVEEWRDKEIWALGRSNIQRVDFRFPADSSFTMQRVAANDTASTSAPDTWLSAGDTLQTSSVSSVLRTLSSPVADGFVEGARPSNFDDALYTVQVQTSDGSRRTLRLRPGPNGENYVAAADGFPYVVQLSKSRWDRSILQGRTALLQSK